MASEKIAVDQARRRPGARSSTTASIGTEPVGTGLARAPLEVGTPNLLPTASLSGKCAHVGDRSEPIVRQTALVPSLGPHPCGPFFEMPNIKQQKKRVRTSADDRGENLRYRSTVKTITRRAGGCRRGRRQATGSLPSTRSSSAGSTGPQRAARSTGTRRPARRPRPRGSSRRPSRPRSAARRRAWRRRVRARARAPRRASTRL